MKKLLITALLLCGICAVAILPTFAQENADTLFEISDGVVVCRDPEPWVKGQGSLPFITGERNAICENASESYPLCFDNSSSADSHYRICGTNTVNLLVTDPSVIDYMKSGYAVEYTVKYTDGAVGRMSVLLAYNNTYYIEAYVDALGMGDIRLCENGKNTSLLASGGLVSNTDGSALTEAILGDGSADFFGKSMNVTVRVGVDSTGMPKSIDLYVNGLLAAKADGAKLGENTLRLVPQYELREGSAFSYATLGNITALNCSSGAVCRLEALSVYSTDEAEPSEDAVKNYASLYGNETQEAIARAEKGYNRDAHILLCIVFGILDTLLVGAAVLIIIYSRKKEKQI